ncbi:MAG TPA: TetR/AcrR family transcriptional regulator [Solirubrobacteraceae bacterium]|jgi:AcrR family transcriptional regulator|nr:TetR/AcrR family transcriptional regulator [Solirubrobacteraceae bacterium]
MSSSVQVKTGARCRVRGRVASSSARIQVSEMQRSRLLSAAVVTVEELGWTGASVAHITERARVSRRTFYDLFDNREDCLLAILDDVLARVADELAALHLEELSWRERVRTGLLTILAFFDREPVLARVCVAQALQGGPRVLARREEILARLASELDRGRGERSVRARECPPLTAEGLVGAVFSITYARLARDTRSEPLTELLGELMGMIVLPYLGLAAARREQARVAPLTLPTVGVARNEARSVTAEPDPLAGVPMRLTYRTARVLNAIAERPGVSNRIVGELAGVPDQGQISKLLARLERLGLTANTGDGHSKGESNAWSLTALGERVTAHLSADGHRVAA